MRVLSAMDSDSSLISWIKMQIIFRILEDKKPHSTDEIAIVVGLSDEQVLAFLRFLETYFIVTRDKEQNTVVINQEFLGLM
jgi:predicted transcriptional regulator